MINIFNNYISSWLPDFRAPDFGGGVIRVRFTWCTGQGTPYRHRLETMGSARCHDGQRIDIVIVTT